MGWAGDSLCGGLEKASPSDLEAGTGGRMPVVVPTVALGCRGKDGSPGPQHGAGTPAGLLLPWPQCSSPFQQWPGQCLY